MRLLPLFLLLCFFLLTHAQRRTTSKPTTEADVTKPTAPRGRGRSRFVATEEFQIIQGKSSTSETTTRRTVASRRRVVENVEQRIPSRVSTASTISKQPLTTTPTTPRRLPSPAFDDTAEKIFTVNENANKRFLRPQKSSKITPSDNVGRKISKPLTEYVERRNFKNTYEVQEIANDDFELVRRSQKPRILTENSFRAKNLPRSKDSSVSSKINPSPKRKQENIDANIPRRNKEVSELSRSLNIPSRNQENIELVRTTEKPLRNSVTQELEAGIPVVSGIKDTNLIEEQPLDATPEPSDLEAPSDSLPDLQPKEDITKVQSTSTTTTKPTEPSRIPGNRRSGQRKSTTVVAEPSTQATRFRTRGRTSPTALASQTSELYLRAVSTTSAPARRFRNREQRMLEPRRGPSVFSADNQFQETRSRTGRTITPSDPEKVTPTDFPAKSRYKATTPKISKSTSIPTFSSRNRFRSREMPVIDEQKLEVLPLFEEEPKLVHTRTSNQADARSRRRGNLDSIQISNNKTETPSRSRGSVAVTSPSRKTEVEESVVSEVNEVTSRRKVSRKKVATLSELKEKTINNGSRGTKKSDVVRKVSSEEVGDSDNYPEEFKALIKAKNEKKINDNENEIKPKSSSSNYSSRLNRKRFTPSSTAKSVPELSTEKRLNTKTTSFTTSATPSSRVTKFRTSTTRRFNPSPKLEKIVLLKPSNERNNEVKRFGRGKNGKKSEDSVLLSTKVPKYSTTSKKYERGKYRGSTTVPPKYIPTIPSVPYVPTVPTITPPRTSVYTTSYQKDDEAVISIDVPAKPISSANLVNGDFVSSTTNSVSVPLPLVSDGTTEKPVSIIERIINSISARSTTPSNTLSSSTAPTTAFSSAILKLSPKKSRQTDGTDVTKPTDQVGGVTLTTENPTTIIERILSSLNAIQATDITSLAQVGTEFVYPSSFTTTPLSVTTARSLLAPSSTPTISLSNLDDIRAKEFVQNQTISRLLDILNSMVSTEQPNDFVVVTPKNVNKQTGRGPFISTTTFTPSTFISDFTTANTISTLPSFGTDPISSNFIFSELPEITSVAPSTTDTPSTSDATTTTSFSESTTSTTVVPADSTTRLTEIDTTVGSEENLSSTITTQPQSTSTIEPTSTGTEISSTATETMNLITLLSSLPPFPKFEVSPASVSVFSANDIYSNLVTPEDTLSTTTVVNIAARFASDNTTTTTTPQSTTTTTTPQNTTTTTTTPQSTTTITTTPQSTTTTTTQSTTTTTTPQSTTTITTPPQSTTTTTTQSTTTTTTTPQSTTTITTTPQSTTTTTTESGTPTTQSTTTDRDSTTTIQTTTSEVTSVASAEKSSGSMTSSKPSVNNTQTNSSRSGKLLDFVQVEPVQNNIDTSTPDYFIFAVLNNNTILRKRPLIKPKSSYYVIGVYPNNTIVKKYPNGTDVPMEMPIRVRGFDTRESPPPLPDITSNQVTSDPGSSVDNKNVETDEQNTIPTNAVTPPPVSSSTSTKPSISSNKAQNSTTQPTTATTTSVPSTKPTTIELTTTTSVPSTEQSTNNQPTTTTTIRITNTQPITTSPAPTTTRTETTTTVPTTINTSTVPTSTTTRTETTTTVPTTINTSPVPTSTRKTETTTTVPTTIQSTSTLPSTTLTNPSPSLKTNSLIIESKESTTLSTQLTSTESISTIPQSTSEASTMVPDMVTVESSTLFTSTTGSNSSPTTFPTLSELFNGKTIEAFNEIVVNSDNTSTNTSNNTEAGRVPKVDTTPFSQDKTTEIPTPATLQISTIAATTTPKQAETTTLINRGLLSNQILDDITSIGIVSPLSVEQRIGIPTTTTASTTSTQPEWIFTSTPPSIIPTFLTTFFPNLFNTETTKLPKPTTKKPDVIRISAAPSVTETVAGTTTTKPSATTTVTRRTNPPETTMLTTPTTLITTEKPTTITTERTTTTESTTTTTTEPTTTIRTTTTPQPTTTSITTTIAPAFNGEITRLTTLTGEVQTNTAFTTARTFDVTGFNTIELTTKSIQLKALSSQQKQNLKAIAQLEKEQAELLNQLSFLTSLVPNRGAKSVTGNGNSKTNSGASLAERIMALAAARDKAATTTLTDNTVTSTTASTQTTARAPKSIQDQLAALDATKQPKKVTPALDDVLKQYNLNSVTASTSYGKSDDALLASLLKEQGIVPSTPKILAGIFDETTVRPKPRPRTTTTPAPGPVMRGLNWLLNTLSPPPSAPPVTKRPTPKPVKPKKPPVEEELLVNSPTHMTPVSTAAPSKLPNSLSQDDIKKLIKQLEGIQKDPSTGSLDLSQIKSIQNLIYGDGGIVISTNGEHGTTSRQTPSPTTIMSKTTQRKPKKLPTLPTENAIFTFNNGKDDSEFVESTTRILRAPIGFNPVPGVDDNNPDAPNSLVRSNLITAAVNVTKAISNFLGTALQTVSQGAASSFQTLFGVSSAGTRVLSSAAGGSSAG